MKAFLFVVMVLISVEGVWCQKTTVSASGVSVIERTSPGVVVLSASEYGSTASEAQEKFLRTIFELVMFKGIDGTALPVPMMRNKESHAENSRKYFESLFVNDYNKTFVISHQMITDKMKRKSYRCSGKITINLDAMKKDIISKSIGELNY